VVRVKVRVGMMLVMFGSGRAPTRRHRLRPCCSCNHHTRPITLPHPARQVRRMSCISAPLFVQRARRLPAAAHNFLPKHQPIHITHHRHRWTCPPHQPPRRSCTQRSTPPLQCTCLTATADLTLATCPRATHSIRGCAGNHKFCC
jgi:hypothetical protein